MFLCCSISSELRNSPPRLISREKRVGRAFAQARPGPGKDSDAAGKIKIPCLPWRTAFRPRRGEPGITVYSVMHAFFIKGLLPKVFNQRILSGALSQTTMGFAAHFASNVQHAFRNGNPEQLFASLLTGGAIKKGIGGGGNAIRKCAVHVKKKIQGEQDGHVDAEDEEFLLESTLEGYLEKTSVRKSELAGSRKNLRECFVQLKGTGLFYTPSDASHPRKILMNKVRLIAPDRARYYLCSCCPGNMRAVYRKTSSWSKRILWKQNGEEIKSSWTGLRRSRILAILLQS